MPAKRLDQVLEVAEFNCLVNTDDQVLALECLTIDGRKVAILFPKDGAKHLQLKLLEAFGRYPQIRDWPGPKPN